MSLEFADCRDTPHHTTPCPCVSGKTLSRGGAQIIHHVTLPRWQQLSTVRSTLRDDAYRDRLQLSLHGAAQRRRSPGKQASSRSSAGCCGPPENNHMAVPILGWSLSAAPCLQQPRHFTSLQHAPRQRLLGSNVPDTVQPSLLLHPACSDGGKVRGAGI